MKPIPTWSNPLADPSGSSMVAASGEKSRPLISSLTSWSSMTNLRRQLIETVCIATLIGCAMAFAGPAESHHDHLCQHYQPNPQSTCRRQ